MKNPTIVIIDYGIGNTHSIYNAIKFLGYTKVKISCDEKVILNSDALILPGVGAFEACLNNLKSRNLDKILNIAVFKKSIPILGVCVGMQLMATKSEEKGIHMGLNWIPGTVRKLILPNNFAVPHVGWNDINVKIDTPLFINQKPNANFYFDHSYHYTCDKKFISSSCNYGVEVIASIQYENIFGVQFHPEKSQINGLKLFRNFFNYLTKC